MEDVANHLVSNLIRMMMLNGSGRSSKKVVGSVSGWRRPFCREFACSSCVCVGFFSFTHNHQTHKSGPSTKHPLKKVLVRSPVTAQRRTGQMHRTNFVFFVCVINGVSSFSSKRRCSRRTLLPSTLKEMFKQHPGSGDAQIFLIVLLSIQTILL